MKKYIILPILALAATITSCNDFLTETPEHSLTLENSVTNYQGAKNIVNGIYGQYAGSSNLGGGLYGNLHCMAGLWEYSSGMFNMTYRQGSSGGDAIWTDLYKVVNAANAAIYGVSSLDDNLYPSVEEKNRLLAEARCWRGFANLHLLWCFAHWFDTDDSPYGIIYRDKMSDLSNLMLSRSTVGESYTYVIDDLKFAEDYLGDYSTPHKLSKQYAQILHAKLLMARGRTGDYAEALTLVNDVMSKAPAKFAMEKDLANLYDKAWDSNELLFCRYLGDLPNVGYYDFNYSYALGYNSLDITTTPMEWMKADERFPICFGTAAMPETWDTSTKDNVLVKLYHGGRARDLNAKYTSYNFRYAELYLMKAELLARTNPSDLTTPLGLLNAMRSTYTNPVMSALPAPANHQELMDMIFKEYVVTLFLENETPWFASLRFEHNGKPWIHTLKPDVNISNNKLCWPIPEAEIIAHTNEIQQNPDLD